MPVPRHADGTPDSRQGGCGGHFPEHRRPPRYWFGPSPEFRAQVARIRAAQERRRAGEEPVT